MEYVILGLLLISPNTLYGIHKSFEQGISMFYSASLGSLQSAVKRLEQKGWITTESCLENGRSKKILTVTDPGTAAFFTWLWQPLEANNMEVSFLSRLYFIGLLPQKSDQLERLAQFKVDIQNSKTLLDQSAEGLGQIQVPPSYETIFFFQKKVLQYGIDTHSYALEWMDALILEATQNIQDSEVSL